MVVVNNSRAAFRRFIAKMSAGAAIFAGFFFLVFTVVPRLPGHSYVPDGSVFFGENIVHADAPSCSGGGGDCAGGGDSACGSDSGDSCCGSAGGDSW